MSSLIGVIAHRASMMQGIAFVTAAISHSYRNVVAAELEGALRLLRCWVVERKQYSRRCNRYVLLVIDLLLLTDLIIIIK